MENESHYRVILGIRFFAGSAAEAVRLGLRGGLVVAPSAPGLIIMAEDAATCEALVQSDLALTDSGLMVLLWNFLKRDHIVRVSGFEYLKLLLEQPELREPDALFWIMPTPEAQRMTITWLERAAFPWNDRDFYLAPHYGAGALSDPVLLEKLQARKPRHIVIAIGGGVQERLGYYLRQNLPYNPAIHCTGAAIGFLSGDQVRIPMWADHLMLGWLFRCVSAPRRFIPRYWKAWGLVPLLLKYRERLPVVSNSKSA